MGDIIQVYKVLSKEEKLSGDLLWAISRQARMKGYGMKGPV